MRLTPELAQRCHREVQDAGPADHEVTYTDEDYPALADRLIAARPPGPFWIFAYGSLIWKPEFETDMQVPVIAKEWHRSFCMKIRRWRGSPEFPGLMMALEKGGTCAGLALRLPEDQLQDTVFKLLYREVGTEEEYRATRFIDVESQDGPLKALAFYADVAHLSYYAGGHSPEEVAHILPRACGHWGSGAEYLQRTVAMLEESGFHDAHLWDLQHRVALEIEAMAQDEKLSAPQPTK
jgi:cation transport protein ChaC